jgi:rhodanese-related sulfurtransferase
MRLIISFYIVFFLFQLSVCGQEDLSCADFYEVMSTNDNVVLFDVRNYEKYLEDRIPGAVYVGERNILKEKIKLMDKSQEILVYCNYGKRSEVVLKILKKDGFKNVCHLKDGFLKWKEQGFPIDDINAIDR